MSSIRLTRVDRVAAEHDPWIAAIMNDYETPARAHIFVGPGLESNERVVFFIAEDGSGNGYVDADPAGYIELSKQLAIAVEHEKAHGVWPVFPTNGHGGPSEYEFEEGTYKYNAKEIVQTASMSLLW